MREERGARTFEELLGAEARGAAGGAGRAGGEDGVCWEKGARREVSAVNCHAPTASKTRVGFSPPGSDPTICVQVVRAWVSSQIHAG